MDNTFITLRYLDSIIYLVAMIAILYFFVEKHISLFLLFAWFILHIFTHKNYALLMDTGLMGKLAEVDREDTKFFIKLAHFTFIGAIIVKTVAALMYTYAKSGIIMSLARSGKEYNPPTKYRFNETEYKKLYIVSFTAIAFLTFFILHNQKIMGEFNFDGAGANIPTALIIGAIVGAMYIAAGYNNVTPVDGSIGTGYASILILGAIFGISKLFGSDISEQYNVVAYYMVCVGIWILFLSSIFEIKNAAEYTALLDMYK